MLMVWESGGRSLKLALVGAEALSESHPAGIWRRTVNCPEAPGA